MCPVVEGVHGEIGRGPPRLDPFGAQTTALGHGERHRLDASRHVRAGRANDLLGSPHTSGGRLGGRHEDDVRLLQNALGPQCDQFWVSGSDPDTVQGAGWVRWGRVHNGLLRFPRPMMCAAIDGVSGCTVQCVDLRGRSTMCRFTVAGPRRTHTDFLPLRPLVPSIAGEATRIQRPSVSRVSTSTCSTRASAKVSIMVSRRAW